MDCLTNKKKGLIRTSINESLKTDTLIVILVKLNYKLN